MTFSVLFNKYWNISVETGNALPCWWLQPSIIKVRSIPYWIRWQVWLTAPFVTRNGKFTFSWIHCVEMLDLLSHLPITCWSHRCCAACNFWITFMSRFSTAKLFHQGLLEIFIFYKINKWINCTAQEVHAETKMIEITTPIYFTSKMRIEVKSINSRITENNEKGYNKKSFDEIISGQFKFSPLCIFTTHVWSNSCSDDP